MLSSRRPSQWARKNVSAQACVQRQQKQLLGQHQRGHRNVSIYRHVFGDSQPFRHDGPYRLLLGCCKQFRQSPCQHWNSPATAPSTRATAQAGPPRSPSLGPPVPRINFNSSSIHRSAPTASLPSPRRVASQIALATNYTFGSFHNRSSSVGNWAAWAQSGAESVCNMAKLVAAGSGSGSSGSGSSATRRHPSRHSHRALRSPPAAPREILRHRFGHGAAQLSMEQERAAPSAAPPHPATQRPRPPPPTTARISPSSSLTALAAPRVP